MGSFLPDTKCYTLEVSFYCSQRSDGTKSLPFTDQTCDVIESLLVVYPSINIRFIRYKEVGCAVAFTFADYYGLLPRALDILAEREKVTSLAI